MPISAPVEIGLDAVLNQTPATPFISIALNGTAVDLVDAAHRVDNRRNWFIISWIDSALAFAVTAVFAAARLAHDLALMALYGLGFPFSASFRNGCKIHLARAGIDLIGVLASVGSIFYPPLIKTVAIWILNNVNVEPTEKFDDMGGCLLQGAIEANKSKDFVEFHDRFFERV